MRESRIRIITLAGIILTFSFFSGCGLFETREPETPVGPSSFWTPPAVPRDVLDNISLAFTHHDATLYMKSFAKPNSADSVFSFFPDLSAVGYDTALFIDWGYYEEDAFIKNLFSPAFLPFDSLASIEFTAENEPPGEDYPVYRETYNITLGLTSDEIPSSYSGKADIRFSRDHTGVWVISTWEDEKNGDFPSITTLKFTTSN